MDPARTCNGCDEEVGDDDFCDICGDDVCDYCLDDHLEHYHGSGGDEI